MSGGDGAMRGSEASQVSSPVVLDLNVDPSSLDEIALELVLGEHSGSVQNPRQKLPPRFDPGMSSDLASHPEQSFPSDSRVFVDLTESTDSHRSPVHRVLVDLVQGNASPSAGPRAPDLMHRDPSDLLHGFSSSSSLLHASRVSNGLLNSATCPFEIPVLSPSMRLHGDVGSSSLHAISANTSAYMHYDSEGPYRLPGASASVDMSDPTVSGVSSRYGTCPSATSLSAVQRVLADFVYDNVSSNVASRELVDVSRDSASPLVMRRMSASLFDTVTRPPISPHEPTNTFTTSRGRPYLNVCANLSQLSSDPHEDRTGPCPIPRFRPSTFIDESNSSQVPFFPPVFQERRSPLFPMRRVLNDLPRQSMGPSVSPFQVSMAEHQNLETLQGEDLGSISTSPRTLSCPRRLSGRPLRWRRARRRIASLLNQEEAQALSTGGTFTREASEADDVIPLLEMPEFSTREEAGISGHVKSSRASFFQSSESNHNNAKEANAGNVVTYFDCNICLEMATDPVVSCCGHLFCWPCLHEWLYVHSIARDCPVCKGFLPDDAIIPIYGRGNVQVSKTSPPGLPRRPSGCRLGSVRCQGNQNLQERFLTDMSSAADESRTNARSERNNIESSSSTVLILDRLRVAQRLQQEYLDRRSRLGQRLMQTHREATRSHEESIATTEATVNSVFSQTRELEESARRSLEIAANNLAAIRASIDGLRANMQGLVEFVNSVPRGSSIPSSEERRSSSPPIVVEVLSDEEGESLRIDLVPNGDFISTGGQLHEGSMESHRDLHTDAASRSSGSCNSEPGVSYARKRRRPD
eukprot:c21764_g1_i1 orf=39-2465(+)